MEYDGRTISLSNYFFTSENLDDLYSPVNIPEVTQSVSLTVNGVDYNYESIFGSGKAEFFNGNCFLDSDLLAATFFMLTRWEESFSTQKDVHNRFPAFESLAYKNNFLNRPIVNEYVDLIWGLLQYIGYKESRKRKRYTVVPTHDIDYPFMWTSVSSKIKSLAFSVIRKPNFSDLKAKINGLCKFDDPYDKYDYLMWLAEKHHVKAYFNFMSGGNSEYDVTYNIYDSHVSSVIEAIINRGHKIGFHPSYDTYKNEFAFKEELNALQSYVSSSITSGRQHYLRFDIPETWRIWNKFNFEWESSLGYADEVGFRCGICYPFPVFDIYERKKLEIYERPLLVMDVTLAIHNKLSPNDAIFKVKLIKKEVKKYGGEFVFLWHNSSFEIAPWRDYLKVFHEMYV